MLAAIVASVTYLAIGDSITSGFIVGKSNNWATGSGLESFAAHLEADKAYNVSFPGLQSSHMRYQAHLANYAKANVVSILAGANDACWGHASEVPERVAALVEQVAKTADTIYVGSIPDLAKVYSLASPSWTCGLAKIECHAYMLGSEEYRSQVDREIAEANNALRELASDKVVFVDIFSEEYTPEDISSVDCFHPSVSGQQKIADSFKKAAK